MSNSRKRLVYKPEWCWYLNKNSSASLWIYGVLMHFHLLPLDHLTTAAAFNLSHSWPLSRLSIKNRGTFFSLSLKFLSPLKMTDGSRGKNGHSANCAVTHCHEGFLHVTKMFFFSFSDKNSAMTSARRNCFKTKSTWNYELRWTQWYLPPFRFSSSLGQMVWQ